MKNKKLIKFLGISTTLIALPFIYNKYVQYKNLPLESLKDNVDFYPTKYGEIAYYTYGNKKGKPLLLLHSFEYGASSRIFDEYLEEFKDYCIYTIDFLGFGLSDKPNITYSYYMYSLIINNFIEEVIGSKTTVLALDESSSALIKASILAPENFKKIILVNPYLKHKEINKSTLYLQKFLSKTYFGEFLYNIAFSKIFSPLNYSISDTLFYSNNQDDLIEISKTGGNFKSLVYTSNLTKNLTCNIEKDLFTVNVTTTLVLSDYDFYRYSIEKISNTCIDYLSVEDSSKVLLCENIDLIKKAIY
ncbi:MAG: alpha/beta fold hydrolase [Lachnospirales bacterium]